MISPHLSAALTAEEEGEIGCDVPTALRKRTPLSEAVFEALHKKVECRKEILELIYRENS